MIKLLIGGSPCTYWSICQKNGRETTAEGMGWELFKNYLIAREKFKPDFFLYENNKSADEAIKMQIRHEFGVTDPFQPDFFTPETGVRYVEINSALVSAQNRERFYVHNCGEVGQPKDRGILLKDILENGETSQYPMAAAPQTSVVRVGEMPDPKGNPSDAQANRIYSIDGKTVTANAGGGGGGAKTGLYAIPIEPLASGKGRSCTATYFKHTTLLEKVRRDDVRATGRDKERYDLVAVPVNATTKGKSQTVKAQYGNTSVVNMCCYDSTFGASGAAIPINTAQNGKSKTVKSQYYKTDVANLVFHDTGYGASGVAQPVEMEKYTYKLDRICDKQGAIQTGINLYNEQNLSDKAPCQSKGPQVTSSCAAVVPQKAKATMKDRVYKVENGFVEIKGKKYPIKLDDGYYMFRPLTVKEVSRLQTMPDDYCRAVSKAQAYKCLGNGWTAEVIIHILSHALGKVPRDEEIVVLSMYDGIATGRYCLDKMGFTNVRYYAYEIDKYAMQVALSNYPDIIECGDAFQLRDENWRLPR